jgi:CHAD domain-containing protein
LYPDALDDLERLSDQLKKSQDALGALNDFIAHREMAADAALHAPRKAGAGFRVRPAIVGQEREASKKALEGCFESDPGS